jgi:hypothetical protein
LVSCSATTSGWNSCSHCCRWGRRTLRELTFQLAIFIRYENSLCINWIARIRRTKFDQATRLATQICGASRQMPHANLPAELSRAEKRFGLRGLSGYARDPGALSLSAFFAVSHGGFPPLRITLFANLICRMSVIDTEKLL